MWNSFQFKQAVPEEFEVLAKEQNELLRDSLSNTNSKCIALNDYIEKNINSLTLEELKNNFLSRPPHDYLYGEYTSEMIELVAEKRPDLFFALAESLPEEQETIFNQVTLDRDVKKSLKNYETDSPIKKEYFKFRRKENLKWVFIASGFILLETAIVGGIVTGIVYLAVH